MEDSPKKYPEFMSKGSLVEVSSEEEGFGGAWYEATVISPPSSSVDYRLSSKKSPTQKDKVHVEYKTLFADDNLSLPLREYVDVLYVRPLPPIPDNPAQFELYDVVDALYKDGWWTGVITRIFQGSRFVVTFQNPPDELEFMSSDLRLHVHWVKYAWVRPRKQKILGLMFGEGKEVEVLLKIKHNQDVWYPATIIENHADSSFLVEYVTLKEDTNETEHQKVTVDCSHIRPSPPPLKHRVFELLEKVDARNEFGWWIGLITKALPGNRYSVFFQNSKKIGEFDHTDVRPQLNWKDGKWWFTSSQEEVIPCQENPVDHVDSEKMKHESPILYCSRESNPWEKLSDGSCTPKGVLVGANLEETEFPSSSLGQNQSDFVDVGNYKSHSVASSPKKVKQRAKITMHLEEKLKRKEDVVTPSCTSSRKNTAMSDKQNGGIDSTCGSPPSNIPGENMLIDLIGRDQLSDYPSWGMRTPKKQKKMDGKENHMLNSLRKPGQAGEECNNGFTKLAEHVERDSGGKKDDVAFVSLERCNISTSRKTWLNYGEEYLKLEGDQKKQLNDLPEPNTGDQLEDEKSSHKRKRGRPRKVSAGSLNSEMTEQIRNTANDDIIIDDSTMSEVDLHVAPDSMLISMKALLPANNYLMPIGDCIKLVCAQLNHGNDSGSMMRKSSSRMPTDSNDQALISAHEWQMPKGAKQMSAIENKISQISDFSDSIVAKTAEPFCITEEVNRTVQQGPGMFNDPPLTKWSEKMHSPGTVNNSTPGASTAMMMEHSIELRQTIEELNGQTACAKDNKTAAVMSGEVDSQNLVLVDPDAMVEQSGEVRQIRKELNGHKDKKTVALMNNEVDVQSLVLVDGRTSITNTGEPELPFVKSSSLWTVIESMEALRKMPQKPHFRPLQQYKASLREGFAIAFMVNFSSAVEKIVRLRFDDTKQKIDDILDSLNDLESHGFEVQVLRDRITELESIKEKHKKLHEEVDVINKQIVSCTFDKDDQDKEISEVTKQIKKLQERIAKAESTKQLKDHEIAVLESKRQEMEETIISARSRYKGLASAVI